MVDPNAYRFADLAMKATGRGVMSDAEIKVEMNKTSEPFWCKECENSYWLTTSPAWNGDVIIECRCGKDHHRQFEAGVAISCEVVTTRCRRIKL